MPGSRIRRVWTQIKRSKWGFKKISGGMFTFSGRSPVCSWPRHFLRPGLNLNHASEEKWEKSDECPRHHRPATLSSWSGSGNIGNISVSGRGFAICGYIQHRVSKFWHFINLQIYNVLKGCFLSFVSRDSAFPLKSGQHWCHETNLSGNKVVCLEMHWSNSWRKVILKMAKKSLKIIKNKEGSFFSAFLNTFFKMVPVQ